MARWSRRRAFDEQAAGLDEAAAKPSRDALKPALKS